MLDLCNYSQITGSEALEGSSTHNTWVLWWQQIFKISGASPDVNIHGKSIPWPPFCQTSRISSVLKNAKRIIEKERGSSYRSSTYVCISSHCDIETVLPDHRPIRIVNRFAHQIRKTWDIWRIHENELTADDKAIFNEVKRREEAGLTAYSCWDLEERASSAKLLEMAWGAMHAACCTCCLARSPLRASRRNISPLSLSLPLSHHLLQPRPIPCLTTSELRASDLNDVLNNVCGVLTLEPTRAGNPKSCQAKRVRIWSIDVRIWGSGLLLENAKWAVNVVVIVLRIQRQYDGE